MFLSTFSDLIYQRKLFIVWRHLLHDLVLVVQCYLSLLPAFTMSEWIRQSDQWVSQSGQWMSQSVLLCKSLCSWFNPTFLFSLHLQWVSEWLNEWVSQSMNESVRKWVNWSVLNYFDLYPIETLFIRIYRPSVCYFCKLTH